MRRAWFLTESLGLAGAERALVDWIRQIAGDVDVTVDGALGRDGLHAADLPVGVQVFGPETPAQVARAAKTARPDAIMLDACPLFLPAVPALRKATRCLSVVLHTAGYWASQFVTPELLPLWDYVVTTTPETAVEIRRILGVPAEKIVVVANVLRPGLGPRDRTEARRKYRLPQDAFVLGYAGRACLGKRTQLLPAVVAHLVAMGLDAHLACLGLVEEGRGEATDYWKVNRRLLKHVAREVGVADRIHLTPPVADPSEWYAALDVALLLSETEGSSLFVREALACGVPVVTTDTGDAVIWARPGTGSVLLPNECGAGLDVRAALAIQGISGWSGNGEIRDKVRTACMAASDPVSLTSEWQGEDRARLLFALGDPDEDVPPNPKPRRRPPRKERPYLQWVTAEAMSGVVDPDTLPARPQRRRRILIMVEAMTAGGAERLVESSARLLSRDHDVWVWAALPNDSTVFPAMGSAKIAKVSPRALAAFCKARGIEVALLSNATSVELLPALRRAGCRSIVQPFGVTPWNLERLRNPPGAIDSASAFWCYPRIAGALSAYGLGLPSFAFRAPVDVEQYPYRPDVTRRPLNLAYVGRFSNEKNLPCLCRVVCRVNERRPGSVLLHVVGGIDPSAPATWRAFWQGCYDTARADASWKALQSEALILEHGLVRNMADRWRRFDACILTSNFEGEPVVYLEAMASGVACIGRTVGEVTTMLGQGRGVLLTARGGEMDEFEEREMADAVVGLIDRPALERLRMVTDAREYVEQEHAGEVWKGRAERVIEEVLSWT